MTALTSWPFDNGVTTSETQWSKLFRELQDTGVADTAGGGGFKVTADGTGMKVKVAAGFALVRGHACLSEAVETVTIAAADASARTDVVVLRLDPDNNKVDLHVVKGTAGAGVPALTQTDTGIFDMPLALVAVGASATSINVASVTEARRYLGNRVVSFSSDTQPSSGRLGQIGYNTSTSKHVYWDGTDWKVLAPAVAWSDITGKPSTFPTDAVAWGSVTGKPSTFTPSAHSHDWASITDKPATFAPATHSHSWATITSKPSNFIPTAHGHSVTDIWGEESWVVGYANGSTRVRGNTPAGSGWYAVWVDGNNNFCHNTSSIRFKENVRDYAVDPDAVLGLQPRVYDRKATEVDGEMQEGQKNEYGLIAEEVEALVPELVVYNDDGEVEALRYDLLAVALLDVVKDQQRRIEALEARL